MRNTTGESATRIRSDAFRSAANPSNCSSEDPVSRERGDRCDDARSGAAPGATLFSSPTIRSSSLSNPGIYFFQESFYRIDAKHGGVFRLIRKPADSSLDIFVSEGRQRRPVQPVDQLGKGGTRGDRSGAAAHFIARLGNLP